MQMLCFSIQNKKTHPKHHFLCEVLLPSMPISPTNRLMLHHMNERSIVPTTQFGEVNLLFTTRMILVTKVDDLLQRSHSEDEQTCISRQDKKSTVFIAVSEYSLRSGLVSLSTAAPANQSLVSSLSGLEVTYRGVFWS